MEKGTKNGRFPPTHKNEIFVFPARKLSFESRECSNSGRIKFRKYSFNEFKVPPLRGYSIGVVRGTQSWQSNGGFAAFLWQLIFVGSVPTQRARPCSTTRTTYDTLQRLFHEPERDKSHAQPFQHHDG